MVIRALHRLGIPSDAAYGAALFSIAGSIAAWAMRNERSAANAAAGCSWLELKRASDHAS